ncbi:tellurite methyltransferase [Methylomarinovum caldicuralii]|uniref:Tellurite methyltransferase n=1 Tax=Methylomarinovum caldicuralii TaxID=438856 RepID=A0AAU9CL30_9GAMM|nr:class I SAM-dependent methyltransferase [Methylomarinovum caldicuralii]BCX82366.1 tellurite methyltransferase [Methylomarinovum caldicuralii]
MDQNVWQKWDRIHAEAEWPPPARVLRDFAHLLPARGEALEVACGLGGNALLLARHGLAVTAWDISPVAIERLRRRAVETGAAVTAEVRDVETGPWPQAAFDVIVVSRFLSRPLCPRLQAALKPGGLLYYQTFIRERADPRRGPSNPAYLLAENALLRLFPDLIVRVYREEGRCGDLRQGWRDEACLVAQKPKEKAP